MSVTSLSNIHNDLNGYNQLLELYNEYKDEILEEIQIELSVWFDANLCAVLGGILDKILNDGLNSIEFQSISTSIQTILQKNSFLAHYGFDNLYDTYHTTIKYLKLKPTDSRYFSDYVHKDLLNRNELPTMSKAVHEKVAESIHEMFVNATIHSETKFVYTCGQFFPRDHNLIFTIVDTGIGFSKRIEQNLGLNINSCDAIKWAMIEGHTTKQNVPGGIGLALLKEFILINKGRIQIISGNGFYQLSDGVENIYELDNYFDGSVISMTFKTDDNTSYMLANEIDVSDIF